MVPRSAPRAHRGQRHDWADRGLAVSATLVTNAWRGWPAPLRELVEFVRARAPFQPAVIAHLREVCAGDEDLEACLALAEHGVPLAAPDEYPPAFHPRNSQTADPSSASGQGLQLTMQAEVAAGRVMPLPHGWESHWVHPLAAVLKANGKIREIHNQRHCVNPHQSYAHTTICTLPIVCARFICGMLFWVVDISSYYRHWTVRPEDWLLQVCELDVYGTGTGLWLDPYMQFGARNSPEVANRMAAMLCRAFNRRIAQLSLAHVAFTVVNTDDWLLAALPAAGAVLYPELCRFLPAAGFSRNSKKDEHGPVVTYTGYLYDGPGMCVRLTAKKLAKTRLLVVEVLAATAPLLAPKWASLFGYLQHVCSVVQWGSMWVQGINACSTAARLSGSAAVSVAAREELIWWRDTAPSFDGCRRGLGPARPVPDNSLDICTDATGAGGLGIFVHGRALWVSAATTLEQFAGTFDAAAAAARGDAQVFELAAFVVLVEHFGTELRALGVRALTWHTDSTSAMAAVNRMSHRHRESLLLLRRLYATLHALGIAITAEHVAGVDNVMPDCLSRWEQPAKRLAFSAAADAWSRVHGVRVHVQEWKPALCGRLCSQR